MSNSFLEELECRLSASRSKWNYEKRLNEETYPICDSTIIPLTWALIHLRLTFSVREALTNFQGYTDDLFHYGTRISTLETHFMRKKWLPLNVGETCTWRVLASPVPPSIFYLNIEFNDCVCPLVAVSLGISGDKRRELISRRSFSSKYLLCYFFLVAGVGLWDCKVGFRQQV